MKKIGVVLKAWFLKEEGKISISKLLATVASLCVLLIALQAQLVSAGIAIPASMIIYFKIAGIVSALIAMIRTRNAQVTGNTPTSSDSQSPQG
jgi:hypothetical protein